MKLLYSKTLAGLTFLAIILSVAKTLAQEYEPFETESPYVNILNEDTTGRSVGLVSTHVDAAVAGMIADVFVSQTYVNSGDSIVEASYVFPMSDKAAVNAMSMNVGGKIIPAVIKKKADAEAMYQEALDNGQTASLLLQSRPNIFTMNLANLHPGDTIIVTLRYTELIAPRDGKNTFRFPTIVGPRFSTSEVEWSESDASVSPFSIELVINAGMSVSAECTSHDTQPEYPNKKTASFSTDIAAGADFVVDYSLLGNTIATGLLLYEGADENFFLAMVQPPKHGTAFIAPKREYIFIMDVSGSMNGTPLETSKEMISNLLSDLTAEDKFNILFFAGGSKKLAENSLSVTSDNIDLAKTMIDDLSTEGGGTMLLPAMETALAMGGTEGFSRTFVILTDGYVAVEKEAYELIQDNLNEANFFAFGIGSSISHYIINGIAYVGNGEPFVVSESGDVNDIADRFLHYISTPSFINVSATFDGFDAYNLSPKNIPDVFADRPILLFGKYKGEAQGRIVFSGEYNNQNVTYTLDLANFQPSDKNEALRYLWARNEIKLLDDYGVGFVSDTQTVEDVVTELGLKYNLVTKYTSFIAVDPEIRISEEKELYAYSYDMAGAYSTDVDMKEFDDRFTIIAISDDLLQITCNREVLRSKMNVKICGISGVVLQLKDIEVDPNGDILIDIAGLPKGAYILQIADEFGQPFTLPFVK